MNVDRRPCPGCQRMMTDYPDAPTLSEVRCRYPGALTKGGDYARATPADIKAGAFRCEVCVGPDTRAWRELGRPASAKPPAGTPLRLWEEWP